MDTNIQNKFIMNVLNVDDTNDNMTIYVYASFNKVF